MFLLRKIWTIKNEERFQKNLLNSKARLIHNNFVEFTEMCKQANYPNDNDSDDMWEEKQKSIKIQQIIW